jgi:hypothetical protein
MHSLKLIAAAAFLIAPAVGHAQAESARLGQKQKAWTVANYRTFECAQTPGQTSLTGAGTVSFDADADGGVEFAVASGEGGAPTVTAHAINTKGTGGVNGRMATQACGAARGASDASTPTCSLSGDEQAPSFRFNVPLAALGAEAGSKSYVGTVTIVKGALGQSMVGMYLAKRGYDYYQAQSDLGAAKVGGGTVLMVIASCDSAALTAKGGNPQRASYDLAVAKK